jgi:anti-anti-sigma factor
VPWFIGQPDRRRVEGGSEALIDEGGHIILDFSDVTFVDSLGLGTLVGLKVSAIGKGYCTLEFHHLSKRVQELLRLTNLADLFKS